MSACQFISWIKPGYKLVVSRDGVELVRKEDEKVDDRYITKQFVFQKVTDVTAIYQDGSHERLRFGKYEAVMIQKQNGLKIPSTISLAVPTIPVMEVETVGGVKLIFDEPPYFINYSEQERGKQTPTERR